MKSYDDMDLELKWSTTSATGGQLSTTLPQTIRTFEEFAKVDVYTGDIDPVYWAIYRARETMSHGWATRFSVAMLAYYHTGTAAKAADLEGIHFWDYLESIFEGTVTPRAAERRHFRGEGGRKTLASMRQSSPNPDRFYDNIPRNYRGIMRYCESKFYGFGPYFQLKIADYMDRCLGIPLDDMIGLSTNLPTLPAKAAVLLYVNHSAPDAFNKACERVYVLNLLAPPLFDRPVGPAEVETILCDWKRAKYGTHWVGDDVLDKRTSLGTHPMADLMPPTFDKGTFKLDLL